MTARRPKVIVAGLGRCGSSMMMQALSASGLSCAGSPPDYEPPELAPGQPHVPDSWFAGFDAIKVLAPHVIDWVGDFPAIVIWLDRDRIEQAKSGLKMLAAHVSDLKMAPDAVQRLAAHLDADRTMARERLLGWPRIEVRFEDLISNPYTTATDIAEFAAVFGVNLNPVAMASVVQRRGTACAPDISIEQTLLKRAEEQHGNHA